MFQRLGLEGTEIELVGIEILLFLVKNVNFTCLYMVNLNKCLCLRSVRKNSGKSNKMCLLLKCVDFRTVELR